MRELKTASATDDLLAPPTQNLNIAELILNLNLYAVAPAIFPSSFWTQAGGVASYGVDDHAQGVQAARLVAKILRGARPADSPVEGVDKIELTINRKTARAFGLTIPPSFAGARGPDLRGNWGINLVRTDLATRPGGDLQLTHLLRRERLARDVLHDLDGAC